MTDRVLATAGASEPILNLEPVAGPVSWGVDFAEAPGNPPWSTVLDGIRRAGYRWLELGPLGYLPEDPGTLGVELAARDLRVAATFVFEPLHDPRRRVATLAAAERVATLVQAVAGRYLVIIDRPSAQRASTAGRPEISPRLGASRWRALLDCIGEIADIAADHGLQAAIHPHAGSFIEFRDEIEAVAEVAGLCLDTGHLALSGLDPVATCTNFGDRLVYLHLKDVDGAVRRRVLGNGANYWDAVAAGVFCPLGRGVVDFRRLCSTLKGRRLAAVEQDLAAGASDPVADLRESREYLERLGVAGVTM